MFVYTPITPLILSSLFLIPPRSASPSLSSSNFLFSRPSLSSLYKHLLLLPILSSFILISLLSALLSLSPCHSLSPFISFLFIHIAIVPPVLSSHIFIPTLSDSLSYFLSLTLRPVLSCLYTTSHSFFTYLYTPSFSLALSIFPSLLFPFLSFSLDHLLHVYTHTYYPSQSFFTNLYTFTFSLFLPLTHFPHSSLSCPYTHLLPLPLFLHLPLYSLFQLISLILSLSFISFSLT